MPQEQPILMNIAANKPSVYKDGDRDSKQLTSQQSIESNAHFSNRNSVSSRMLASERMRSNYSETKFRKPLFGADMSQGIFSNILGINS